MTCRKQVWSIESIVVMGMSPWQPGNDAAAILECILANGRAPSPFQDVGWACSGSPCVPMTVFWLRCFRVKDEKYIIKKYASKYFEGIYQISFLLLTSFFNFTCSFSRLQNTRYFPQWKSCKEEKNICSYKKKNDSFLGIMLH